MNDCYGAWIGLCCTIPGNLLRNSKGGQLRGKRSARMAPTRYRTVAIDGLNMFYREAGQWKPVTHPSGYACEGDRYNRTTFDVVETDGLRLEVQLPDGFSSGIHEWRVEEAK